VPSGILREELSLVACYLENTQEVVSDNGIELSAFVLFDFPDRRFYRLGLPIGAVIGYCIKGIGYGENS
jgi:hypothetical protein